MNIQRLKQEIKQLIEELNYRTEQKSADELIELSQRLFRACLQLEIHENAGYDSSSSEEHSNPIPSPHIDAPKFEVETSFSTAIPLHEEDEEEKDSKPEELSDVHVEESNEEKSIAEALSPSLNQRLSKRIMVDFNDRFAFVNQLFDGNQEDFNSVISQLNTMGSYKEAYNFIENIVKPDYNWKDKEEYEERFLALIERHLSE